MKKYLFILFISLGILSPQYAQLSYLSTTDPDYVYAEEVYSKLVQAVGDFRHKVPKLIVWKQQNRVAFYNHTQQKLVVDQAVITICREMGTKGKDALAFLLGHELTHFYKHHNWEQTAFVLDDKTFHAHQHQEAEADYNGVFIAYLAGYEVTNNTTIAVFLDQIYTHYHFKEQLAGYLPLAERKKAAQHTVKKTEELINIYESANYFTALGLHWQAKACYDYIVDSINVATKEIYNNLGVSSVALAQQIQPNLSKSYQYPLSIDLTKIFTPKREPSIGAHQEALKDAIHAFQYAYLLDPSYIEAHINGAYALFLYQPKDIELAQNGLEASFRKASISQQHKILLAQGVIAAMGNRRNEAEELFKRCKKESSNRALKKIVSYNQKVLKGIKKTPKPATVESDLEDKIDRITLSEVLMPTQPIVLYQTEDIRLRIGFSKTQNSRLTILESIALGKKQQWVLQRSQSSKVATQQAIKVGMSSAALEKAYHLNTKKEILTARGSFYHIATKHLIFNLEEGKVKEWALTN